MQLSEKQKAFSQFFLGVLKPIMNFKNLPKKMILEADVYLEIPARKNMVT